MILSAAVITWVGAFDIIYALQDVEFDKTHKVFSIPSRLGIPRAIWTARGLHLASFGALAAFGVLAQISLPYWVTLGLIFAVLVTEHLLVREGDLSRVGVAFFTMNGIISILLYIGILASSVPGIYTS
jgi:4-hydroxybenzoate polyprenyltransferase